MAVLSWSMLSLPPINLWSYPVQHQRNIKQDNRARSLKLNPRPRATAASQVIIEPARGVGHSLQTEQILNCIAWRNGAKRG